MAEEELYIRKWGSGLALSVPKEVWCRLNLYHGKYLICTIKGCKFLSRIAFKGRAKMIRIPNAISKAADFYSLVGEKVIIDLQNSTKAGGLY